MNNQQPTMNGNRRALRFTYPSGSQPLEGYTIKRGIGIGGFGEVYFAVSEAGKEVAIKRIQRNLDVELRGVRQCLNLKHVNLIGLWDIKSNDLGESWVVMEYVPGYCLRTRLADFPSGMPIEEAKDWFLSILAGVHYLHNNGIVHRDLKPGNIFFDQDQQVVKIGDYGLSKFISCSKRSGQTEAVGTFHYMAPEIGKGIYGKEIDVYALGVILYELLSGELPFEGESAQEIIMKHLTADPDLTRVPTEFHSGITGALAKDPEKRFKDVPSFLSELPWSEESSRVFNSASRPMSFHSSPLPPATTTINEHPNPDILYIGDDEVEVVQVGNSVGSLAGRMQQGIEPVRFGNIYDGQSRASNDGTTSSVRGNEEPIARAFKGGIGYALSWWNRSEMSVPVKVTLSVIGAIVVIINSSWLLLMALGLGFIYLLYYTVWSWFVPADHDARTYETNLPLRPQRADQLRQFLASRPISDRITDALGSMVIAAISCGVFSLIALAVGGSLLSPGLEAWKQYVWMVSSSILASWMILSANKSWEHRDGDHWTRRMVLISLGCAVGVASYFVGQFLAVESFAVDSDMVVNGVPQIKGLSQLAAFAVFFAVWFGISRIWLLADPTRKNRFGLWKVGLQWVLAVVIGTTLNLNPILFGMFAIVVALSTQLAAPLISVRDSEAVAA
ncbi:MAG: serine/threonine-protein kinase [Pirellulaceae bacterium]